MTTEELNFICEKLVSFQYLDNQLDSAKEYAHWLLTNIELCWRGGLIPGLLGYLREPGPQRSPRQCVKALRVLHEMTTHCTKVDLKRLVLTTDLLLLLRDMLQLSRLRGTIKCCCLALMSNILVSGWRLRDAVVESGLLTELLQMLTHRRRGQQPLQPCDKGQVLWLLYQVLRYKVPGPTLTAIRKIAQVLPVLLHHSQDVELLLPALQLARLISEYHSTMVPAMVKSKLLSRVVRFVLSPLPEVQREAIFVLANVCLEYRRRQALFRFPKSILLHVHGLVLGGRPDIRVLVLQLLGGIIDNRCIKLEHFVELGLLKKIVQCASKQEKDAEVRLAAGWTLVSLALHLCRCYLDYFIDCGALHAICDLLRLELPVQLLRNILVVLFLLGEKHCHSKQCLLHVMWQCNIWPKIQALQGSNNAAVRTLCTLLTSRHAMELIWPEARVYLRM
ncbi:importin subunit alpha-5-like [Drosophila montana]|uniref:importin subunit alpha-5-like n=1 Tax=Drosophila montana TaxID=40370 RepID=UPI00313C70DD